MSLFRLLFLAGIVILIGACGSNDEDIEVRVNEAATNDDVVMPADDADEDIVATPENDVEPEPTDVEDQPQDTAPMTERQNPEDGMPQQEDLPQQ